MFACEEVPADLAMLADVRAEWVLPPSVANLLCPTCSRKSPNLPTLTGAGFLCRTWGLRRGTWGFG